MIGLEYILRMSNINNTELADKLDIKTQNISRWFSGERKIPERHLNTLSDMFNVSKEYLINHIDNDINYVLNFTLEKLLEFNKVNDKINNENIDKAKEIIDILNNLVGEV